MIQQTQDQWLDSNYIASSYTGGLDFPDYRSLADSFSMDYCEAVSNDSISLCIKTVLQKSRPTLCNVLISDKMRVIPQVKSGYPNEDMEPLLTRDMFSAQMNINSIS